MAAKKKQRRRRKPAPPSWPADQVERRAISDLRPDPRNAKKHPQSQVDSIAAAIEEWGWTIPVLVDERDSIVAGHGRVLAAKQLGIDEIPVVVAHGWSEAKRRAYLIADNKLAESPWDRELLATEVAALAEMDFSVSLLGFSDLDLKSLSATGDPLADDGYDGKPSEDPVTWHGDVWLLGRHRLMCGDSTDADQVSALLGSDVPFLMVTDPPYGVAYDPSWRNRAGLSSTKRTGKVPNDDRADWTPAWRLFPGNVAYVWHASWHSAEVQTSLADAGLLERSLIIWNKSRFALSRGNYHWRHELCRYAVRDSGKLTKRQREQVVADVEAMLAGGLEDDFEPCWYAIRSGAGARWTGDRRQSTVWDIDVSSEDATVHGTQKPIECMGRPIRNHDAEFVYDPFVGSGTTLIAAEALDRACLAMELDPAYVDLVVDRWRRRTGGEATLASGGATFTAVSRRRRGRRKAKK